MLFARLTVVVLVLAATSAFNTNSPGSIVTKKVASNRWQKNPSAVSRTPLTSRRHAVALVQDPSNYDPYIVANTIHPETKPLPESIAFYAKFVVKHFSKLRLDRKTRERVKGKRRAMWKKLDEQRKNIMTLAGYTSHIVFPSFLFLFLGAFMTSVVPSYYSKCIQCVSTLTASRAQLVEAVVGLGVTSTLAALFTGLRGSLFWIGGKSSHFFVVPSEAVSQRSLLVNRLPSKLQRACQATPQFASAGNCLFRFERDWIFAESIELRC